MLMLMLSNADDAICVMMTLTTNFEKAGGEGEEGDQKRFLELPRATPGS